MTRFPSDHVWERKTTEYAVLSARGVLLSLWTTGTVKSARMEAGFGDTANSYITIHLDREEDRRALAAIYNSALAGEPYNEPLRGPVSTFDASIHHHWARVSPINSINAPINN